MLQRIQTVWLFFATAAIFSLFLFPYIQLANADGVATAIKVTGVYQSINQQVVQTEPFLSLTIATVILGLIPFIIIFFYKDRKRQIAICYLFIVITLGYTFWLVQATKHVVGGITLQTNNYGIGVILPSIAILFVILAIKGIRRDEKLVRSVDRLR